jgi:hypothetical protein
MTEGPATGGSDGPGGSTPDASSAGHAAPGATMQRDVGTPDPRAASSHGQRQPGADLGSPVGIQPRYPNNGDHGRLAIAGWVLYLVSWVTPSTDGKQFGATAFLQSVRLAWHLLTTGSIALGLCVTLGWLANFSILPRRLPTWLRVVAMVAPWLAFAAVLAKLPARATYFPYFYPWALGIALIHAARCSSMKAAS